MHPHSSSYRKCTKPWCQRLALHNVLLYNTPMTDQSQCPAGCEQNSFPLLVSTCNRELSCQTSFHHGSTPILHFHLVSESFFLIITFHLRWWNCLKASGVWKWCSMMYVRHKYIHTFKHSVYTYTVYSCIQIYMHILYTREFLGMIIVREFITAS